jgi:hypothetical protein
LAKVNSGALNLALIRDEFEADMFDQNTGNEQNIDENEEASSSESDEENIKTRFDTSHDVLVFTGGEGNESNIPQSAVAVCDVPASSRID